MATAKGEKTSGVSREAAGFLKRNQDSLLLALLVVYVVLLAVGTVAELFHIESILRWPIYR